MGYGLKEVENTIQVLTGNCNIGVLHPFDEKRIVSKIWELAKKDLLNECDIPKLARENHNWQPHAVNFLKCAVEVIGVLYPMAKRGDIKI